MRYTRHFLYGINKSPRGFTLIEALVSIGLFLIVVGIAISAVVSVHSLSARVQNTSGIADSLSFVLSDIVRGARLGVLYSCGTVADGANDECESETWPVNAFSYQQRLQAAGNSPTITYKLNPVTKAIEKQIGTEPSAQLTSENLEIDYLNFHVFDALAGDDRPSRVLVTIEGTYGKGTDEELTYRFQTTVTQRIVEK